jgi:DNA-directed RNA polymerase specialized sigma subunit
VFASSDEVIWALLTYMDWWQPATASVIEVGAARRDSTASDGIRAGLLETLDGRTELCRRMERLDERERHVLFLWYIRQLAVHEIARELHMSRRQCFRLRSKAVEALTDDAKNSAA